MNKLFVFQYSNGDDEWTSKEYSLKEEAEVSRQELKDEGYDCGEIEELRV